MIVNINGFLIVILIIKIKRKETLCVVMGHP